MAAPSPSRRVGGGIGKKTGVTAEAVQDTFSRLAKAIELIQGKQAGRLSFEEHYRYAYTLCLHRHPDLLYNGIIDLVQRHLQSESSYRIEPAFPPSSFLGSSDVPAGVTGSASGSGGGGSSGSSKGAVNGRAPAASTSAGPSQSRQADGYPHAGSGSRIARALEGETFLDAMKGTWEDHKTCMRKLRDILKYMDKVHTEPKGLAPTYTLGLHLFLVTLLRNDTIPIQSTLLSVTLALIRIERDGETVNRGLLKTLTDMLCELREVSNEGRQGEGEPIYKTWWEDKFLEATKAYYAAEAEAALEKLSAPEYLQGVDRRLLEESDRVSTYLHPSTHALLFSLLDNALIQNNLQAVVDHPRAGLAVMLTEGRIADLSRMYRLFGRVGNGHAVLMKGIKSWLVAQGQKIVESATSGGVAPVASVRAATGEAPTNDVDVGATAPSRQDKGKGRAKEAEPVPAPEEGDNVAAPTSVKQPAASAGSAAAANNVGIEWVNAVLALKDKMDTLWIDAFEKDRAVQNAINDAFSTFVNQVRKSPEYISIFLDENLKKGLKGKNESEVDAILDKTIVLFRFLTDKDVFEDYYKRHLARRLYLGRSVSDDAERTMLQKLKLECGSNFVTKLEGMLKDVGFSEELNTGYKRYLDNLDSERPGAELSVQVCTSSFWPTTPEVPCILPAEFVRITKSFERYFNTRFTGRKLTWHAEHGNVDVRVRFHKGAPKELNVATQGFVVLSLFENLQKGEEIGYPDIAAGTGLPERDLKRILQSLACAKYKILRKDPATRTIGSGDRFSFNHAFTDKLVRIKVQTVASRVENAEETRETDTRLEAERAQVVEAALVRIMKSRKRLPHAELVAEAVNQLRRRFTPKPVSIKLAIDKLIEKEYLERDEQDKKMLKYLA